MLLIKFNKKDLRLIRIMFYFFITQAFIPLGTYLLLGNSTTCHTSRMYYDIAIRFSIAECLELL